MAKVFKILVPDNTLVSRIISCEIQVTRLFVIDRADKKFVSDYASELNKPALYILVNRDNHQLYVGETDDSLKRLRNHETKDFWKEAIVFHSTNDTLSTTEVKWLEAKTYETLKDLGFYDLSENKQIPQKPTLKKDQIYTLEPIFEEAKNYICAAGFDIFLRKKEDNIVQTKQEEENLKTTEHLFYCKQGACVATGYYTGELFMMLHGSEIRPSTRASITPAFASKRKTFLANHCTKQNGVYKLKHDYSFPSPSTAAGMCVGGSANGWTEWIDEEGKTLNEIFRGAKIAAKDVVSSKKKRKSTLTGNRLKDDKAKPSKRRDKTRYSFDGETFYSKSHFVHEFISKYIEKHPDITYDALKLIFHDGLLEHRHRVRGLLFKKEDYDAWTRPDKAQRYGAKQANAILTAPDGVQFYVNTQWTQGSVLNIIEIAKQEGIKILIYA